MNDQRVKSNQVKSLTIAQIYQENGGIMHQSIAIIIIIPHSYGGEREHGGVLSLSKPTNQRKKIQHAILLRFKSWQ